MCSNGSELTETGQVERLVVATRLPTRGCTARLKVYLPILTVQLACQEVEFCRHGHQFCLALYLKCPALTSAIAAALSGDDGVPFKSPSCSIRRLAKCKSFVRGTVRANVEIQAGVGGLDRACYGEILRRLFWSKNYDRGCHRGLACRVSLFLYQLSSWKCDHTVLGVRLKIVVEDGALIRSDLLRFGDCGTMNSCRKREGQKTAHFVKSSVCFLTYLVNYDSKAGTIME